MKKVLTKKIKIKDIYLIFVIVLGLIAISLYSTYALFTGSVVITEAIANVNTDINIDFDINSNKTFSLDANTKLTFYANVNNNMSGDIYYELYHDLDSSIKKVVIAEVVSDPTVTTSAPNTSGTLGMGEKKNIPLVIENKSNDKITVTIGLAVGYTGNTIEYGTGNYPSNVTVITDVYDDDKVPAESCSSAGPSIGEDCNVSYSLEELNGVVQTVQIIKCPAELDNADLSGASLPALKDGMIPVKWDSSNNLIKADATNPTTDIWYNYNDKIWANAVMVSESTRTTYMNADVGTPINGSDILAYFVWIPRYKYQLFNVSFSSMSPIEIQIEFENKDTTKSSGSSNGSWLTHPAFTFGTDELSGIWVGKFETTGSSSTPTIKPGEKSLKSLSVSKQFSTSQLFSSSGYINDPTQVNAHMMKNTEWGAVAYLKQSKYGLSLTDIAQNTNSSYYTGGGRLVGYVSNIAQSTTGNVYGIYDMSGGSYEYVMGNYNSTAGSSGITFSSIDSKYYDVYTGNTISSSILGDALGETKGWYGDTITFVTSDRPFFIRGGLYNTSSSEAGLFYTYNHTGVEDGTVSFRVVVS